MDYRNADGSIAEMCGNGVRVFARYLLDHGLVTGPAFAVATRGGVRQVQAGADGQITVDMGPVTILGAGRAAVGGLDRDGLRISVGNPHLACLVDGSLDKYDLAEAPVLDPAEFPDGGNVELVRLAGPGAITMRVHERGSGETQSCGTGAVAAAAAAQYWFGGDTPGQEQIWQVHVPGGELTVTLGAGTTWLTGPAVIVAEGELDPRWLAASG
jgi:diaminopimelate epimerase